eukprot:UC1_evm1s1273
MAMVTAAAVEEAYESDLQQASGEQRRVSCPPNDFLPEKGIRSTEAGYTYQVTNITVGTENMMGADDECQLSIDPAKARILLAGVDGSNPHIKLKLCTALVGNLCDDSHQIYLRIDLPPEGARAAIAQGADFKKRFEAASASAIALASASVGKGNDYNGPSIL